MAPSELMSTMPELWRTSPRPGHRRQASVCVSRRAEQNVEVEAQAINGSITVVTGKCCP